MQTCTHYHTPTQLTGREMCLANLPNTNLIKTDLRYNTPNNKNFTIHHDQQHPHGSKSIITLLRTVAWLLTWNSSAMSGVAQPYPMGQCGMGPPSSLRLGSGIFWNNWPVSTRMPGICTNSKQNLLPSSLTHPLPVFHTIKYEMNSMKQIYHGHLLHIL